MHKYLSIGLIATFIALAALVYGQRSARDERNPALYDQFLASCRMVESGSFEDPTIGFGFKLGEGLIACDRREQLLPEGREVYVLRRASLKSPMPLGQGIVGKVSVNQPSGLPGGVVIKEERGVVAGVPTTISTMQPPACGTGPCSLKVRTVELQHDGKRFLVEEYASEIGLLDTFVFMKTALQSL